MKVLIGTTNPAKIERFQQLLDGYDIEFLTLKDLNINDEPQETGSHPQENAIIKAKYYGQYFDLVLCNDSGLYFDTLALDDKRQPGLNIRSPQGKRLNDEQMITYYSSLIHSLGGQVKAYYLDGIAVYNHGHIYSFMEKNENMFYMVDKPALSRHVGWPLDSLSIHMNTNTYFVENANNRYNTDHDQIMIGEYRKHLVNFLIQSLQIEKTHF